jgi:hypothetical protein
MSSRHAKLLAAAVILAATCGPARGAEQTGAPTAVVRDEIERLETRLDRAVDRVSLPHPGALVGRADSARGYRLPGYGLVFVLTPRRLPGADGTALVLQGEGHQRVLQVETRHRAPAERVRQDREEEEIENLERQVLTLQARTEEARRAAEQEMERLVHDVRILRLSPSGLEAPPPAPQAPSTPEAPAAPEAPSSAPAAPPPPEAPPAPPPPPWKFWFEATSPPDDRTPEALVADVRKAVIDALGAPDVKLSGLGGDEFLSVAVDFVPGDFFASAARPEHTLVVRARVRDIEARGRGAITPGELRRRVLVVEY